MVMTIKTKLTLLCSFLVLVIGLQGTIAYFGIKRVTSDLTEVALTQLPAVRNMTLIDMMHDGLRSVAYHAVLSAQVSDQAERNSVSEEFEEMSSNIKRYLSEIEKLTLTSEVTKVIAQVKPQIQDYITQTKSIVDFSVKGDVAAAQEQMTAFQTSFSALEASLGQLGELIESTAEKNSAVGINFAYRARAVTTWISILTMLLGLIASWLVVKNLMKTLRYTTQELLTNAYQIDQTSRQLASSAEVLSKNVVEQSASLEETTSSLEEISAMVARTSDSARDASHKTEQSKQKTEEGQEVVSRMMRSMEDISASNEQIMTQVNNSNQQMGQIVGVIKAIGDKTKVINDIVFQTKLLSFNASVEAARAGEHGKGFAVVAQEVGNLAQMSGNAAKEISQMLQGSMTTVETIIEENKNKIGTLIDEARDKIQSGSEVSKQCVEVFHEVAEQVVQVSSLAKEISHASGEQSQGVAEINKAMGQLDQVTQQNAATAEQCSEAAVQLASGSGTLKASLQAMGELLEGKQFIQALEGAKSHPASTSDQPSSSKRGDLKFAA